MVLEVEILEDHSKQSRHTAGISIARGGGKNNNNKMSSFGPSSCHSSVAVINHTTIEYLIKLSFIKSIQMEQENSGAGKHNRIKQMRKDNRTKETQGINAQRK